MKKHTGKKWNRRQFIRNTALAAGGLMVGPNIISSTAWGQETKAAASERITVGVIGVGGRGRGVMNAFMDLPDVHVVAVCDTYGDRRQAGVDQVNQR
ncbi:MAG: twin-arginine translocation signal domain-containing protein, partial [Candidatus Hydrogenedentes bacterium]|nr:twin-arginine translocation signal domain-containing protein [Candidatus Hydrogenedentota bacterium]